MLHSLAVRRECLGLRKINGIIRNFIAASVHTVFTKTQNDDAHEEVESNPLPQCDLALGRVYNILDRMSEADVRKSTSAQGKASLEAPHDDDEDAEAHALEQSSQINGAMKLTADLWKRTSVEWPEAAGDTSLGYDADSLKALQTQKKQDEEEEKTGKAKTFKRSVYLKWKEACIRTWSK